MRFRNFKDQKWEFAKLRIVRNIKWTNKTKIFQFLESNYDFPNCKKNSQILKFGKSSNFYYWQTQKKKNNENSEIVEFQKLANS